MEEINKLKVEDNLPNHDFGEYYIVPEVELMMKQVGAGSFHMGSEEGALNERPQHRVNITRPFWLGVFPVTQEEYENVIGENPANFRGERHPVEKVSWTDVIDFCEELTERERDAGRLPEPYVYRLPTEAEWEYACRAGNPVDLPNEMEYMAWYYKNSNEESHEVGLKDSNAWGFYDMHGNVFEWVLDSCDFREPSWYEKNGVLSPTYKNDVINPISNAGSNRVAKGGCWLLDTDVCRASARYINPPDSRYFVMGFRLCLGEPVDFE